MACVGEAGKSQGGSGVTTPHAKGGDGGGVGIAGGRSAGDMGSGAGGVRIPDGNLTLNGVFGTAAGNPPLLYPGDNPGGSNDGGQTITCTKGVYWSQQGIPPCNYVGTGKFRLSGGEEVTNTTTAITRGYKSGYNIIQTAGAGIGGGMRGGNGATGGQGGGSLEAPGGGGSGYQDGSVTVVDSRLGGSTGDAKVVLRLQS